MKGHPPGATAYLWRRLSWRHAREEWLSTALLLLLLAFGVAAFLSIRLANRSAVASFELFHRTVQAHSDWILRAPAGSISEERLGALSVLCGQVPVTFVPVKEVIAPSPEARPNGYRYARVVGLDLIALGALGNRFAEAFQRGRTRMPGAHPPAWLAPGLAAEWQIPVGGDFSLHLGGRLCAFRLAGTLPAHTDAGPTPENLVLVDVADLLAAPGVEPGLDRIEVILPLGRHWRSAVAALRAQLESDEGWALSTPAEDSAGGKEMTAAFRLNLTVLSLIALLVASYLIAQALDALVVRRRLEIGILRSLGLTESMILRLWRNEFIVLGLAGGLCGLLLGWMFAQFTAGAVAETVNALYYTTDPPPGVPWRWTDVWTALGLGLGGSLVAGWLPLRDAARTPPAQVLAAGQSGLGVGFLKHPWPGLAMLLVGLGLWPVPPISLAGGGRFPLAGYAAAFLWLIGGTFLASGLFPVLARALKCLDNTSAPLRIARARLQQASSRHRMAAAGLLVAIAMAAAMNILVSSFSRTMEEWIDLRLRADLFLSSASQAGADTSAELSPAVMDYLENQSEVVACDPLRRLSIHLPGGATFLAGTRQALVGRYQRVLWIEKPPPAPPTDHPGVWVSEAFVERFGGGVGDLLTIPIPSGEAQLRVTGIFADYGNERGLLWVDWSTLTGWFEVEALTHLSVFLKPGADAVAFGAALSERFPTLVVRDNAGLRREIMRIFRQTFAVTEALKVIGLIVALGGLALALGNHLRESRRELRTLRLLGCRRPEISLATAYESIGIAAVGLLGGICLSIALGGLLVFVINKQSFGWTLQWRVPWPALISLSVATIGLAAGVGYLVGWHHAQTRRAP